ncbi:MAG TPA: hypothetical protein VKG61_21795, partial [Streptosporangiaceae bacterium]|nr:hypothetical protein [Streptosporangiaceae bacterium]
LCALSHRRPSSLPFRIWHPDGDTVIECVTVHSTARVPWRGAGDERSGFDQRIFLEYVEQVG